MNQTTSAAFLEEIEKISNLKELVSKIAFSEVPVYGTGTTGSHKTKYDNPNYFGEFKKIPPLKKAANVLKGVGEGAGLAGALLRGAPKAIGSLLDAGGATGAQRASVNAGFYGAPLLAAAGLLGGGYALGKHLSKDRDKVAFQESMYSAGTDMGALNARNNQNYPAPLRIPALKKEEKRAAASLTLATSSGGAKNIGKPSIGALEPAIPRGPSISQQSKPKGADTGTALPGATKSSLPVYRAGGGE